MSAASTPAVALTIADGHYPSIEEINGLPFDLKVVLYAIDIDFDEYLKRKEAMERIVKTWNAHDDLVKALGAAESFIAGFEDDELQEGMEELMSSIRAALAKAGAA